MKGYKVFESDWTCRGFQYAVGQVFEEDVTPVCCERGFHFCKELKDCFNYYSFNPNNKVAIIEALGDIDGENNDSKCCTNKIHIVQELTRQEVLTMVNIGKGCTGFCNTGFCNTGDRNTGNCNTGDRNTGNCNTGDRNTGDRNTGFCNTGDRNTGNRNTGNGNTGNRNTGNWNTGSWNTGSWNTGDCNTGSWNTGDWNTGDRNTGCFCTEENELLIFDKPSRMFYKNWIESDAKCLLNQIPKNVVEWIYSTDMSNKEKEEHPEHETTGGYLKVLDESECGQMWWDGLSDSEKEVIKAIPNFDAEKFKKCTGISI